MNVPSRLPIDLTMYSMKKHNRRNAGWYIVAACLSFVSCLRDDIRPLKDAGEISFNIETWQETATRSDSCSNAISVEVAGRRLELALDNEAATKSAALDNGDNSITKVYVSAIERSQNRIYFNGSEVDVENGKGISGHFWPAQPLSFFSYAASKENKELSPTFSIGSDGKHTGSFSYTLPSPSSDPKIDASSQPDIVFAITPDQSHQDSPEVDLVFHHALSAIVFKVGRMPEGTHLENIGISGVYSSGECTITAAFGKDIGFTWNHNGTQNGNYSEDIDLDAVQGEQIGSSETVFMMIPQQMGTSTNLHLTLSIDGRRYTMTKAFKDFISSWEADKKYVFTIGLPDEIDVSVDDMAVELVKNNVKIQNTGIATGYIRAAITGYWVNSKNQIEMSWNENADGTFYWGTGWDTYWYKGTDGFYYHRQPVSHLEYTYPLFDKYIINQSIRNSRNDMTLELAIAVQIVPQENVSVWPAAL